MGKIAEKEDPATILLNDLVVHRIMKNLDTENLLSAAKVNKTWISEARRVLRDERKCLVFISGENPCSRAAELNDLLGSFSTTVVPFNGISITMDPHVCDIHLGQRRIDEIYGNLMQLMDVKYLHFKWSTYGNVEKCPLGQVILRFMARSASLEELRIEEIPMNVRLEPENALEEDPRELPNLKILKLPQSQLERMLKANLFKVLSDRAPQLAALENEFFPELIGLLSPEKLHILKSLCVHGYSDQAYAHEFITNSEEFLNNMKIIYESEAKLRTLSAIKPYFIDGSTGNMGPYMAYLLGIIVRSSDSLQEVTLDHFAAVMLNRLTIDCLTTPNVTKARFVMFHGKNAGIVQNLQGARLREIFANVTSVRFTSGLYKFTGENVLVAEANAANFPWPAVEEVDLGDLDLNEQTVTETGALFPNLRAFTVQVSYETPGCVPFQQIWSSWPALRSLTIGGKLQISRDANFDAVFCGIHAEEAEMLLEKDDEFLTAVNLVPPFPAISHLKGLKNFKMELELEPQSVPPKEDNEVPAGKMFLSKVTGLTALRRMPDLVFQVMAPFEAAEYLDHLKVFVGLDFHPPNPTAGMSYEDTFKFFTGTHMLDTLTSDFFANLNLELAENIDEDDDHLEEFDFSGRF